MELASEDSFAWVRAYFHRLLLEPERGEMILVAKENFAQAKRGLAQCRDAAALNAWLEQFTRADAQRRCRNALYQRKCSQSLQRLSLKKSLYLELTALAAERGETLNQVVAYLLALHRDGGVLGANTESGAGLLVAEAAQAAPTMLPSEPEPEEEEEISYEEQMILWAMSRTSGSSDED